MNYFSRDKTFCSRQIFFFMRNLLCLLRSGLYSVSGLVGSRVTLAKILSKIRVSTARSAVFNKPHDLKMKSSKRSVPYPTPLQFFSSSRDCLRLILTPWVKRRNDIISMSNPSVKHCSIRMNPNHWNIWQYSKGSSELDTHTRTTEEKDEHCFPVCCKAFDLIIIW